MPKRLLMYRVDGAESLVVCSSFHIMFSLFHFLNQYHRSVISTQVSILHGRFDLMEYANSFSLDKCCFFAYLIKKSLPLTLENIVTTSESYFSGVGRRRPFWRRRLVG